MKEILRFLLLIALMLTGVWFYQRHQEKQRNRKALEEKLAKDREATRQKLFDFYKSNLDSIKQATTTFTEFLNFHSGYFTNYQLTTWKNEHENLFNKLIGKPFELINLSFGEIQTIKQFNNYFSSSENLRNDYNKTFISKELQAYSTFFDKIEGRKLDKQQRTAIVTDEDNNMVIAGAGSGKTTTIVGKVNYVIDRYKVNPEEILLISFTNKSASTLANRVNIEGVQAKTFHKFGKDVIVESEGRQPSIFDEAQFLPLLTRYFQELTKDQNYLKMVTEYFIDFLKPVKSQFEFANQGDYIQYIKDQNFRTYKLKEITSNGKVTYQMEVVKSIEECKIANFLLFNGVDYKYEFPYEHDTANEKYRQYKPDFTIHQNGRVVYLEHFAVARNGNIPEFFRKNGESQQQAKNKYWEKIHWARQLHADNNTTLIETYSYEMSENILFENLTKHLTQAGIILQPKPAEEIWEIINRVANDEIKSFIKLFGTFITLMKSNNYSISPHVIIKNRMLNSNFSKQRNSLFIDILKPIYKQYEKHLAERGEIDFSDMINKASMLITNGKFKKKFSYVVIDEFQDISIGRYQLINSIKASNPSCKLFCVGDDWQSIYRFSGSDIALFKEFEKYFGFTAKSKIETTYRFHNPLIKLSSDFIQKNPNQAKKELKGTSVRQTTDYKIHYSTSENHDDTFAVLNIFNQLLKTDSNIENKTIYMLGRYSFDFEKRLKNETGVLQIDRQYETVSYSIRTDEGVARSLTANFMTVHKAKGLEADVVIVLNCNSGKHGFPSEMSDDQVLNLLLSEADQFENGEERRLFYVAMTRAKQQIYFIADSSYKSKFIAELEVESGQTLNKKCPNCVTADIVLRKQSVAKNGNRYKFYGCTNYLYGCDYTNTEWVNLN